jgi:serine/threonine-protein kinase
MWGELRLLEELGRGAFGRVFRAWDQTLAREVALKILRLESADPSVINTVLREGQMLARIRHRNVVTVHGARQIGSEVGLWMELVRGRTLAQMVREDGPMGPEEAAIVGLTLCDAVAAVHAAGLLHRDIKAQNVMRESGGRLVLMDFGAGVDVINPRRHTDLVGTPLYMSPDVLAGAAWSPVADVYSLGVLLFYLVTARFPVEGHSVAEIATAHALGEQRTLADYRAGLPEGFARVVRRALGNRYRTVGAMMRDLTEAIPGHGLELGELALPTEISPRTPVVATTPTPVVVQAPAQGLTVAQIGYGAGVVGGITLIGFLTSAAFDQSLGRIKGYSDDSLLDMFIWGVRALFAPASYMLLGLIAVRAGRGLWRLAVRFIPPFTRWALALRRRLRDLAPRFGFSDRSRVAQWVLAAQVLGLAVVIWFFRRLIGAYTTFLDEAPAEMLRQLSFYNDSHLIFRTSLSMLILAMIVGWRSLLTRPHDGPPIDAATKIAGIAVIAVSLLMLTLPFRLVFQSTFPVAIFAEQRCFVTGQRPGDLLLFCPDARPRIRRVPPNDPSLRQTGEFDRVFR